MWAGTLFDDLSIYKIMLLVEMELGSLICNNLNF